MELSNKDKKLLVYLLAICIIAGAYFFGARPLLEKYESMNSQISELKAKVSHLNEVYINQELYANHIVEAEQTYADTLKKFFGGLNQDNTLVLLKNIESNSNVWISKVAFQETEVMVGGGGTSEEPSDETEEGESTVSSGGINGIKQDLSIDYSASYSDYKKFLEYVINHDERLFISSITSTYIPDTNKISGTLVLSQYAIEGAGIEYSAPDLSGVSIGVDNIFSTLNGSSTNEMSFGSLELTEGSEQNSEDASENAGDGTEQTPDDNTEADTSNAQPKSPGVV